MFSGTGNTCHAATKLAELLDKDAEVTIHQIEDKKTVDPAAFDLNIFMFPIYSTAVPAIMCRYITHLKGSSVRAAVISTNGRINRKFRDGYQGWALHQARLLLALRGFKVFFSDTLDYPHNLTIGFPASSEETCNYIILKAEAKLAEFSEMLVSGTQRQRGFFLPHLVWSLPIGISFTLFGRFFIGKLFAADDRCIQCGLCAQSCPASAISVDKKGVNWHWKCEGCLRCLNICPQQAIQTSLIRLIVLVSAIFWNPLFRYKYLLSGLFCRIHLLFLKGMVNFIIDIFIFFLFFVIIDYVLILLSRLKLFRNIVSFGYTRYYGRYFRKIMLKSLQKQHFS